jgi:hypothetical protein
VRGMNGPVAGEQGGGNAGEAGPARAE